MPHGNALYLPVRDDVIVQATLGTPLACWRVVVPLLTCACVPDILRLVCHIRHSACTCCPQRRRCRLRPGPGGGGGDDPGAASAVHRWAGPGMHSIHCEGQPKGLPVPARLGLRTVVPWPCMAVQGVCAFSHHHDATCRNAGPRPERQCHGSTKPRAGEVGWGSTVAIHRLRHRATAGRALSHTPGNAATMCSTATCRHCRVPRADAALCPVPCRRCHVPPFHASPQAMR